MFQLESFAGQAVLVAWFSQCSTPVCFCILFETTLILGDHLATSKWSTIMQNKARKSTLTHGSPVSVWLMACTWILARWVGRVKTIVTKSNQWHQSILRGVFTALGLVSTNPSSEQVLTSLHARSRYSSVIYVPCNRTLMSYDTIQNQTLNSFDTIKNQ